MKEIFFYLPGFFHRMHLQLALHQMMERYPEAFFENIRIGAVYGSFPGAIWNGGRTLLGRCDEQQMEYVLDCFAQRHIPVRFTYTNCLLTPEHLEDAFCNRTLELAAKHPGNEILVNSPLLEDYLRKNYPGFALISSTTKQIRSLGDLEAEAEKDYKLVVVYKSLNNTGELFGARHREKMEILVDSFCMDACPRSAEHYREASRAQLMGCELEFPGCEAINRDFYDFAENKSFVRAEDLYGRYRDSGFAHFKLDGRTFTDADVIESYVYYMVRDEYKDRVRLILHKTMEKLARI